ALAKQEAPQTAHRSDVAARHPFAGGDLPGNWLLKVDVEGLEHRVVRGAEGILPRVKYCITETSIRKRHEDSYRFADLIALMRSYGFDLYDVLTVTRRRVDAPRASIMD